MSWGQPGKTGTPMRSFSVMPPVRASLVAAVLGADHGQPLARRAPRVFNGTRPARAGDPAKDALILEVRRLHEQCGMSCPRVVTHLADAEQPPSLSWVKATCNYHNRSHLVPTTNADSYLPYLESQTP